MFLFLDVASPIPEFHLFDDKKIIYSINITADTNKKLSDNIIPTYLKINKAYNLANKITNLIITTGPGSYTALRIGSSFIAGLSQSMNLPVCEISSKTIYDFLYDTYTQMGIYFESSNNQKFFSYKKELNFIHEKIENEKYIFPKYISHLFYNFNPPLFINKKIKTESFSIKNIILKSLNKLDFKKNTIIKPIYISNNIILN